MFIVAALYHFAGFKDHRKLCGPLQINVVHRGYRIAFSGTEGILFQSLALAKALIT